MKEIGEYLRQERRKNGVGINEASEDLHINSKLLEAIEEGNHKAFKDVFELKDAIRSYAKYLGLNVDKILDEFNDFIFGYTSRIPIEDILEQTREFNMIEKKSNNDKVVSPYTKVKNDYKIKYIVLYVLGVLLLIIIVFLLVIYIANKTNSGLIS